MTTPTLKLYNTLTREKQIFTPIDARNVGLYVCGVTPYDDSHIGHARVYVVFDVLYRLLRHVYGEKHVTYVRNFTDIDDKIIQRAHETGQSPAEVSEKNIASFYEDMDALNILRPNHEPRVSDEEVIRGIVEMTDELIAKGYAYETRGGDVMYRTQKFPRFGELARRKLDEQRHGERVKEDTEKESPNDFVLWKANAKSATKLGQAFNPKDYHAEHFTAPGRPGWHIECSVMSKQHLGPTFDIHGGGEDLQFPHHCCEIAQSEALLPPQTNMANYWLHNGFITVNGTKMSKSLGNFTTIKQALEKYSPEAIRLWLLQTHYRKPVDFSDEALQAAEKRINSYRKLVYSGQSELFGDGVHTSAQFTKVPVSVERLPHEFLVALGEDLNTSKAISMVDTSDDLVLKVSMLAFLGINITPTEAEAINVMENEEFSEVERELLVLRDNARRAKNFPESDRLRDELKALGIEVMDGPNGQTWRRI